jgi:hypothetical protein
MELEQRWGIGRLHSGQALPISVSKGIALRASRFEFSRPKMEISLRPGTHRE